jgi:uncharacterized protein
MDGRGDHMIRDTIGQVELDGQPRPIVIDADAGEIAVRAAGSAGTVKFRLRDSTLSLIHTEVAPALRGKGVAEALARAALAYARGHGLTVKPYCPFVASYITRHPEYQDLIDPDFSNS